MKILRKLVTFALFLATTLELAKGKMEISEEQHTPIQIFFSPIKDPEKLKNSKSDESLIKSENKAIELKIHADGNKKSAVDLIIAATKEVQVIEEPIDRYSPKYNAERDIASGTTKGDTSDSKAPEISRQDPTSAYQSTELSDVIPFARMQQIFQPPQPFPLGRNQFSPLQNLRHLEENLQREVLPMAYRQSLDSARYVNNEVPFGMLISQQPQYNSGFGSGDEISPESPGNYQLLNGIPYAAPFPSHYVENAPMIFTPQRIPFIQKEQPEQRYRLGTNHPQSSSNGNHGDLYYRNIKPIINSSPHQGNQPQLHLRDQRLYGDPAYDSQSNLRNPLPERHFSHIKAKKPEYGKHYPQHPLTNIQSEYLPPSNYPANNDQSHILMKHHGISIPLNQGPRQVGHQKLRNEEHDRNLYYTPVRVRGPKYEQRNPVYISEDIRRPSDNSHLYRTRIIPEKEYHEVNNHPVSSRLHTQTPTNLPRVQQAPHYTLVPQRLLPKYLQGPVYRNSQETHQSMGNNMKNTHAHRTLPEEDARPDSHLPYNDERHRDHLDISNQRHRDHQEASIQRHRDHQDVSNWRHRDHQDVSNQRHRDHLSNQRHRDHQDVSNPAYRSEGPRSGSLLEQNLSETQRTFPQTEVYSGPSYHQHSRDLHGGEKSEIGSSVGDTRLVLSKRRLKYKSSDIEDASIPQQKELIKTRKSNLRNSVDDLEGHSTHQYVIKIG